MKYSDYKRLGKISIASRKKSTRNTVRGISFGLIILIPIIFFAIAFYLDLTNKVNDVETIASFQVTTKHHTDDSGDTVVLEYNYQNRSEFPMLGFHRLDQITNLDGVSDYLVSEYLGIPSLYQENYSGGFESPQNSLIIGDKTIPLHHNQQDYDPWRDDNKQLSTNLKILYPDRSSTPYLTEAEANDLKKHFNTTNFLVAGEGFKDDGKQQVMLSERFLQQYDIAITDIINKKVSLEFVITEMYELLLDYDNDSYNEIDENTLYQYFYERMSGKTINIFEDFEVVGIISENLYKLKSRESEADIWFHSNSLYNGESYYPTITSYQEQIDEYYTRIYTVATYPKDPLTIAAEVASSGLLFIPIGFGGNFGSINWELSKTPFLTTLIQCEDYHQATIVEGGITAIYNYVYGENYYNITNDSYFFFSMIYKTGFYVIIVLLAFGGIIFFATLLNLYNSINYSVQSRRNYIGVMRAIGSRESVIPKLYFVEIMLIFMRAFIWILIFSGLISYGIKALIDYGFTEIADDLGMALRLNFFYFPVTIAITVFVEFTIAFIYSQVACRHVSKKPILEILKDEK